MGGCMAATDGSAPGASTMAALKNAGMLKFLGDFAAKKDVKTADEAFDALDEEKNGVVSLDNLKKARDTCGLQTTDEELDGYMKKIDKDGNGTVSKADFTELCKGVPGLGGTDPAAAAPKAEEAAKAAAEEVKEEAKAAAE